MAIQILSPQLANQIAAGEVVERPASVVKELIENSLDAGASKIQIDIEQGGATLIRIRDNGCGISKADLSLALTRHATSKIATLDDLETILSLGFRGEALASISSVSRLTLTSRPAEQNEAWQVFAQGREMETTIKPASHPVGTTVEVANLFFNTPARRRFLRTDKTEFGHIDEIVRRIALAKSQTQFILNHNGKLVRHYKVATTKEQQLKRLAAICGQEFVDNALHIDWQYGDLHLYGWVATENFCRSQNDFNYSYVNGRSMRDKTINHAVRQAFATRLSSENYPAFVLFIDLNPNQVDVNVHPAKHEVRFHQSRLVHDFIYQGVLNALQSAPTLALSAVNRVLESQTDSNQPLVQEKNNSNESINYSVASNLRNRQAAGENLFASGDPLPEFHSPSAGTVVQGSSINVQRKSGSYPPKEYAVRERMAKDYMEGYAELLKPYSQSVEHNGNSQATPTLTNHLRLLSLVQPNGLLLQRQEQIYLMQINALQQLKCYLSLNRAKIEQQRLLIPLNLPLSQSQWQHYQQQQQFFQTAGFELEPIHQRLRINTVPSLLRQQNLQRLLLELLSEHFTDYHHFLTKLSTLAEFGPVVVHTDALRLLTETEQLLPMDQQALEALLIIPDFTKYLTDEN